VAAKQGPNVPILRAEWEQVYPTGFSDDARAPGCKVPQLHSREAVAVGPRLSPCVVWGLRRALRVANVVDVVVFYPRARVACRAKPSGKAFGSSTAKVHDSGTGLALGMR
jgi:hypothetical protein